MQLEMINWGLLINKLFLYVYIHQMQRFAVGFQHRIDYPKMD